MNCLAPPFPVIIFVIQYIFNCQPLSSHLYIAHFRFMYVKENRQHQPIIFPTLEIFDGAIVVADVVLFACCNGTSYMKTRCCYFNVENVHYFRTMNYAIL